MTCATCSWCSMDGLSRRAPIPSRGPFIRRPDRGGREPSSLRGKSEGGLDSSVGFNGPSRKCRSRAGRKKLHTSPTYAPNDGVARKLARTVRAVGRPLFDIRSLRQLLLGLALAVSVTQGPVVHAVASAQTATPVWVQVSVATVWYLPWSPRPVDAPALANPAGIEDWLTRLSVTQRLGLDSRINTQVLLGQEVLVLAHRGRWSEVEAPDQRGSRFPTGIIGWGADCS